jgi:uncharacterized membrane protein
MSTLDNAKKINALNFYFMGFWTSVMVGVLLCSVSVILIIMNKEEQVDDVPTFGHTEVIAKSEQHADRKTTARTSMLVGIIALITASVLGCVLHSLLYRQIYDDTDPTTFAQAALSCFVPLLAVFSGVILMNFSSVSVLPFRFYRQVIFLLFALIGSIVAIFFFKSVKDNAVRLLESEE